MILISTPTALRELADELGGVSAIGVDTEGDSYHSYHEKTCLIQISTRDADYIVDPLALPDLSALRPVFADTAVLKVFHAADNDVAAMRRDFQIETHHLFDTMIAARILGITKIGLADFLREHFAVETDKRMQRYAWGSRPLTAPALQYAALDSHYLVPLRDIFWQKLAEASRLEEAGEEFVRVAGTTATERMFDPESFWRIKGSYTLTPAQRAVLRELYIWRDRQAAAADRPPFRIAPDAMLLALAVAQPRDRASLERTAGVPQSIAGRYGNGVLAAIRRGSTAAPPEPPRSRRPDDAVVNRYEALRAWRKQAAAHRGVEPDVIVSNAALQTLATETPATETELAALKVIGAWKLRTYGPELLRVLREQQS